MDNKSAAKSIIEQWKETIAFYLEDIETPIGQGLDVALTGLIVLSSTIFVAETYPISEQLRSLLDQIDFIILILFALEYSLRLICTQNKLKFITSLYSIIDLIAILPFFLGVFNTSFFRLLRWFRILRLIRFIETKTFFGRITSEDGAILARILFTLFIIIFIYSGLIYQVEHPANPQVFATFLDAVYFSIVTMTTVGFGDVTPSSEMGRLLTLLMILTGIALIPWQLGDLIKQLVKTTNQVKDVCLNCGLSIHDSDASYCKICGHQLSKINRPLNSKQS